MLLIWFLLRSASKKFVLTNYFLRKLNVKSGYWTLFWNIHYCLKLSLLFLNKQKVAANLKDKFVGILGFHVKIKIIISCSLLWLFFFFLQGKIERLGYWMLKISLKSSLFLSFISMVSQDHRLNFKNFRT